MMMPEEVTGCCFSVSPSMCVGCDDHDQTVKRKGEGEILTFPSKLKVENEFQEKVIKK